MATGVKPRDEDVQLTKADLENIQDAMKSKKFRDMLAEYCDEVRDPANQALYQKEMTQLEKERGYDVTFINPKGGYVIKTSVAGDRKAFINICSNDKVGKPSCAVQEVAGRKGLNWQIPYSLIPPREDYDNNKKRCVIYDVVFHPDTLRMADQNKQFRGLVNKTAFDALQSNYDIHLDSNNLKFPKSAYKGMVTPAVIRKEDPNFKPSEPSAQEDNGELSPDLLDKLYPQRSYTEVKNNVAASEQPHRKRVNNSEKQYAHAAKNGYTIPKYVIKQQKNVDFQDYTFHKDSKQYFAIPSQIVVEVELPLLSSTQDCTLDVQEKSLSLTSEKPAKYKLTIPLPYSVDDQAGNAKFDKSKRKLIVSLPVMKPVLNSSSNSLKADSGVESEDNSMSDEDYQQEKLVEELPAPETKDVAEECSKPEDKPEVFLDTSLGYTLPPYTHNALDDTVAFTFHVKNTEPDSVKVMNNNSKIFIKFTSVGSGFVPVHYAATIVFEENVSFESVAGEAWDNNVILQLEVSGKMPQSYEIGLDESSLNFETIGVAAAAAKAELPSEPDRVEQPPVVEVVNIGNETNIVVSSNGSGDDCNDEDDDSDEKEVVWVESHVNRSNAKSILRKPRTRSLSESSVGDIASSMDYMSSDCHQEESSFKKTVRFSEVIGRQFYRYNSSIEGQKKKNQRKKSKKRSQDQRRSESEAEEDSCNIEKDSKPAKSAIKQRRDSGLADTSDAEAENKSSPDCPPSPSSPPQKTNNCPKSVLNIVNNNNVKHKPEQTIWETKSPKKTPTCDTIKHHTDLYNPDKLNKGEYLEVKFKNDLIFDLDM